MSLAVATQWEVRAGGADVNGGGFNPSNPNMATDLTATGGTSTAPVVSSASYTFVSGDVGAWVFVQAGTNWSPGWYKIVSVAGGAATLDASIGAVVLYGGATLWNVSAGVATTGSPSGGTWSVDYSQQTGAAVAVTDAVTAVSTTVTSASAAFGVNHVGNLIYLQGGTGSLTAQWREVVTQVNATTITVDVSLSVSTGVTLNLGGALASLAQLFANMGADHRGWVQKATYPITVGLTGPTASPVNYTTRIVGYATVRGDGRLSDENRPTMVASADGLTMFTPGASGVLLEHLIFDGASRTGGMGLNLSAFPFLSLYHVKVVNMRGRAILIDFDCVVNQVEVANCGVDAADAVEVASGPAMIVNCWFHDNPALAVFLSLPDVSVVDCLFTKNAGTSLFVNTHDVFLVGNVFYANGGHGVDVGPVYGVNLSFTCHRNIFAANAGYGIRHQTPATWLDSPGVHHNAFWANGSGPRLNLLPGLGDVDLTGDPFVGASSEDYALNATPGAGAACRGAGYPGLFPGGSTRGFADIGVQHADPPPNPAARLVGVIGG